MKKPCENGEYNTPVAAESALREFVERELSCQKKNLGKSNPATPIRSSKF
jgi:hypothetical protein